MKICSKCNYVNDDDNLCVCPECGNDLKWIDREIYENNQRFLAEFYKKQREEIRKKELLEKYEDDFRQRKISLDEIIRYRKLLATDEEKRRMNQEETAYEERVKQQKILMKQVEVKNVPKCPTCGSHDIKKISAVAKIVGAGMFGLLSKTARSQFECKNCGYKW